MQLPAHDFLDDAGIAFEKREFPADTEKGAANVARALGFEGPEEPVTLTQLTRGRAELAYVTALDGLALTIAKLLADLWLYTTREFGFATLPVELSPNSAYAYWSLIITMPAYSWYARHQSARLQNSNFNRDVQPS